MFALDLFLPGVTSLVGEGVSLPLAGIAIMGSTSLQVNTLDVSLNFDNTLYIHTQNLSFYHPQVIFPCSPLM